MVSTRSHPKSFPSPTTSPSKALATRSSRQSSSTWAHTPSNLTLIWLIISLPLVIWDTGYVLLRPHTMPGGSLHSPIYTPYTIYISVDHMYGWPAFNDHIGLTSAQGILNLIETAFYGFYLWCVYVHGEAEGGNGRGAPDSDSVGWIGEKRSVRGRIGAWATVIAFTAAVMTVSKTVLYGLNEYCSGFKYVGHNDTTTLILVYVILNGLWILFPSYMINVFAQEILQGLSMASEEPRSKSTGGTTPLKDE